MTLKLYQVISSGISYSRYGNMEADGTYVKILKTFLNHQHAVDFARTKGLSDSVYSLTIKDNVIKALYKEMNSRSDNNG